MKKNKSYKYYKINYLIKKEKTSNNQQSYHKSSSQIIVNKFKENINKKKILNKQQNIFSTIQNFKNFIYIRNFNFHYLVIYYEFEFGSFICVQVVLFFYYFYQNLKYIVLLAIDKNIFPLTAINFLFLRVYLIFSSIFWKKIKFV